MPRDTKNENTKKTIRAAKAATKQNRLSQEKYNELLDEISKKQLPQDFYFETRRSLKEELSLIQKQTGPVTTEQLEKLTNTLNLLTLKDDQNMLSSKQQEIIKNFEQSRSFIFRRSFADSKTYKALKQLAKKSVNSAYREIAKNFAKIMTQKGKIDLKDKVNAVTGLKNSVFYIESPLQDGQPEREYEELKAKDLVRRSQVPFINAFDKNLDAVKHEMQNLEDQKVTARLDQLNQIEDEIKKLTQEQRDKIGIKADRDSYLIDITAKKAAEEVVVALTKLSDEQLATLKSKIENVKSQSKQGSVKRVEGSRDSAPKEEQDQMILDQTILKLDKLNQIEDEIKNLTQEQRDKIGISADGDSYLIDITAKEAAEKVVVELTKLSDEQLATLESKIKNVKSQSNQGFAKRVEDSRDSAPKFER